MPTRTVRCPVLDIARALRTVARQAASWRPTGDATLDCDVRLQISESGSWALHSGSSDYDQDHSGVWGAGSVPLRGRFDSMSLARELWNQAVDMAVDGFADDIRLAYAK